MHLHHVVIAAGLALLLGAPPAAADGAYFSGPAVAASPAGAVAAWARTETATGASVMYAADAPPGGAFGAPVEVARASSPLQLAGTTTSGGGETLVVWERMPSRSPKEGGPPRPRVEAALRPAGGAFGPVVQLSGGPADADAPVRVAMSESGHAAVAWVQDDKVQVALRGPGGPFGPPAAVPLAQPVGLGIAGDGRAVLGGITECGLDCDQFAVALRPAGGAFGTPRALSPATTHEEEEHAVAVGEGGEAVALYPQDIPWGVAAVRWAAGSGEPSAPESLAADAGNPIAGVTAAGEAVVAWTRFPVAGGGIFAASAGPGAPFGAAQALESGRQADFLQVDVDPDGRGIAVWRSHDRLRFARRRAGEGFGRSRVLRAPVQLPFELAAAGGTARLAFAENELDRRAVRVATVPRRGAVAVQTLSEEVDPPAPRLPVASIPARVRVVAQGRDRRVRVPVVCSVSPTCRGRVTVRAGRRSWRTAFGGLRWEEGGWVNVRAGRRLRRAVIEVTAFDRTDRRTVRVRARVPRTCPSPPFAETLGRGGGTVVSVLTDPGDGDTGTSAVSACRPPRGRGVTLFEGRQDFTGVSKVAFDAWAGPDTVALKIVEGVFSVSSSGGSVSISIVLHDARTGRRLSGAGVGSVTTDDEYPAAREIVRTVFTPGGDAVYAAQVGGDVRIGFLGRDGTRRVLDEGSDVDAGSLRARDGRVTWMRGDQERSL